LAIQKRREAELAKRNEHSFAAKIKDVFDDDGEVSSFLVLSSM